MVGSTREQEKAQALRQSLALGDGYVNVFSVLGKLGIELYRHPVPGDGLEGCLTIRDGVAFVFVNSQGALTRQRLTAAHELGHFELGGHRDGTEILEDRASILEDHGEHDAFRFARYFLMDVVGVRRLVAQLNDDEHRVAAVASAFLVSPMVAAIHLAELHLIPRSTKDRLKADFERGVLRPVAFLARYGYQMDDLSDSEPKLDPGHISRAIAAFDDGQLSLPALAEVLMMDVPDAERLLREAGIDPSEPPW